MKNSEQPAFASNTLVIGENIQVDKIPPTGLTKREYFAAMAMQGLCAYPGGSDMFTEWNYIHMSQVAVQIADALLIELEK